MAKLTRKTAKIFGETASTSGNNPAIGQFGSAKAGTYVGTGDIATIQSLTAWSNGWIDAVTPTHQFPTLPEMTGVHKVLSYQEAYLLQEGAPEWDANTTYYIDSVCKGKTANNELVLFRSKTDNNTGNALTNTTHWEVWLNAGVNKELSNLSTIGENRLHALKSYEDAGESLSDSEGLADVANYAHSTFDSAKLTTVGTPALSSEGIASGFSDSNYFTQSMNFGGTHLKARIPFRLTDNSSTQEFFQNQYVQLRLLLASGNLYPSVELKDGTNTSTARTSNYALQVNTNYVYELDYVANTSLKLTLYAADGVTVLDSVNSTTQVTAVLPSAVETTNICKGINNNLYFKGFIDLLNTRIYSDGASIFNVAKTDTDVINDYAVTGSPTITNNVASGFSASNYLTKDLNLSGQTLKIRIPFSVTDVSTSQMFIYNANLQVRLLLASGNLYPSAQISDGVNTITPRTSNYAVQANTNYVYELEYITGTSAKITLYAADGVTVLDTATSATATAVLPNSSVTSIIGSNAGSGYLRGSIDLAGVRVETDTMLYRPCIAIPFTWSKTGSKVVNVAYKNRVDDLYTIKGLAPYYVLDEANGTFQIPQGELYGMVRIAGTDYSKPNYKAGGVTVVTTPFTAESGGWLYIACEGFVSYASLTSTIDGAEVLRFENDGSAGNIASGFLLPIQIGQTYDQTLSDPQSSTQVVIKFFKSEGV